MAVPNLIPRKLDGKDFLCGSHFSISNDDRFLQTAFKSTFHHDFVPPSDKAKPEAAFPPIPANFMHHDREKINENISETAELYVKKRSILDDKRDKYASLYKTNFKMNSDERIESFQTTHDHYFKPTKTSRTLDSGTGKRWMKSSLPQGDKEKADDPISCYRESFFSQDVKNAKRDPISPKRWSTNTLVGDNQRRFFTTHDSTFTGVQGQPATSVPKHFASSIPQGDKEKVMEKSSTMKHSYQPSTDAAPYDSNKALGRLYATNFTLSDKNHVLAGYKTTQGESYTPLHLADTRIKQSRDRNASDIPEGDLDEYRAHKRVNNTSTRSIHKPINVAEEMVPRVDGSKLRTVSNVHMGEKKQFARFYDTTCDSTYKPVIVPYVKADSHPESVVPLKYYGDRVAYPTTFSDFPTHDIFKSRAERVDGHALSATHFNPPLGGERSFETTQHLHYIPKQVEKIVVDEGRLQRSTLPIGTMGKYIKGCHTGWE